MNKRTAKLEEVGLPWRIEGEEQVEDTLILGRRREQVACPGDKILVTCGDAQFGVHDMTFKGVV